MSSINRESTATIDWHTTRCPEMLYSTFKLFNRFRISIFSGYTAWPVSTWYFIRANWLRCFKKIYVILWLTILRVFFLQKLDWLLSFQLKRSTLSCSLQKCCGIVRFLFISWQCFTLIILYFWYICFLRVLSLLRTSNPQHCTIRFYCCCQLHFHNRISIFGWILILMLDVERKRSKAYSIRRFNYSTNSKCWSEQ